MVYQVDCKLAGTSQTDQSHVAKQRYAVGKYCRMDDLVKRKVPYGLSIITNDTHLQAKSSTSINSSISPTLSDKPRTQHDLIETAMGKAGTVMMFDTNLLDFPFEWS